jgi:formylglycine-generating enzyme required for sulfatase activity
MASMRRWFLSYNSQDLGLMSSLEAALKRKDPDASIFLAPKSLRVGGFWLPKLAQEIGDATAFILLVGANGIGPWQVIEYYEALDRRVKQPDFPVVLVLLDGQTAPGLPFLRQLHWIITADPSSENSLAQLMDAVTGDGKRPRELWRHTAPYRGLTAMTEADSDFFFGRGRETGEVIGCLAESPEKLPVLLGNSGVGKSSLAQAGVIAAFMRQAWPESAADAGAWPQPFSDSRRWCVLALKPGTEPIRALVEPFLRTWQLDATDPQRAKLQSSWISSLLDGTVTLRDLLDATELRYSNELHQPAPPAFLLYVDQGEELYIGAEERQRRRFSEVLAQALADPRLRALISLRADFFGELQKDEPLYACHRQINVPPLRETELREVVSRPAMLLGARFETERLAGFVAHRTAEESTKDAGALPLLSYLLDDMWRQMVSRGDAVLRLPEQAIELGAVLVDRAEAFLTSHPKSEDRLRQVFTLKLATVLENGEPNRRRALRSEFSGEEWRLVSELANEPYRLLVTVTPEAGEVYAEVAHEAIFRRWNRLHDWIIQEREFLIWRSSLEVARRAWEVTPEDSKKDALLMGLALAQGRGWLAERAENLSKADKQFIGLSIDRETRARARSRRLQAVTYVLLLGIITGLVGWINQSYIKEQINWIMVMRPFMLAKVRPYVLTAETERALRPKDLFRECAKDCPEMVVVPAGQFVMGSPQNEKGHAPSEGPQHTVVIAEPFAVSKFEVTYAEWDACTAVGGCPVAADDGRGRGTQPVAFVSWYDAQQYVAWLSQMTGRTYRLLSEAEWEYAARGGTTTAFPWGEDVGKNNAVCARCGSQWDGRNPAPVGSFMPNAFGLYDTNGNVEEWCEDSWHPNYEGAPQDGSAWQDGDPDFRVLRGAVWRAFPLAIRSASRKQNRPYVRVAPVGFRIARTLAAPS